MWLAICLIIKKDFLHSFYSRKPDWKLLGIDGLENLPAVRWRELNLDKSIVFFIYLHIKSPYLTLKTMI